MVVVPTGHLCQPPCRPIRP